MEVLVTGGRGFVGMNIARALARRGARVYVADRGPYDSWVSTFLADESASIEHLTIDLSKHGDLDKSLSTVSLDAVVHAAVVTATTEAVERSDARDIVDSNVGGTVEALQVAVSRRATKFIYVSSPSAIGDLVGVETVDESIVPHPSSLYGITKYASEQIVERWANLYDLAAASVRIAQPYGPGERATGSRMRTSPIWEWLRDAPLGGKLATGPLDQARDWTYVEETADGVARMVFAESLSHRLYHLGTGSQVTVGDVIAQLSKRFPTIECDLEPLAADLNPNISGPGRSPLDVRRFASDFGWKPQISIEDGMERYIAWWDEFRQHVDQTST
jgi:nucleoside-diphosphate-sugar epimerase